MMPAWILIVTLLGGEPAEVNLREVTAIEETDATPPLTRLRLHGDPPVRVTEPYGSLTARARAVLAAVGLQWCEVFINAEVAGVGRVAIAIDHVIRVEPIRSGTHAVIHAYAGELSYTLSTPYAEIQAALDGEACEPDAWVTFRNVTVLGTTHATYSFDPRAIARVSGLQAAQPPSFRGVELRHRDIAQPMTAEETLARALLSIVRVGARPVWRHWLLVGERSAESDCDWPRAHVIRWDDIHAIYPDEVAMVVDVRVTLGDVTDHEIIPVCETAGEIQAQRDGGWFRFDFGTATPSRPSSRAMRRALTWTPPARHVQTFGVDAVP